MGKKLTVGKLFGIIFCIIGTAAACVLLGYNIYLGGQMKLVDKYLTAIERADFDSYSACINGSVSELVFDSEKEKIAGNLEDSEEFKLSADFTGRKKLGSGKYSVTFSLTVYNDTEHVTFENNSKVLVREGGKWLIDENA